MEPDRFDKLTPRQRDCLRLLAAPMRPKEIATSLNLSVRTVEGYIAEAVQRLGAQSALHAARLLAEHEQSVTDNILGDVSRVETPAIGPVANNHLAVGGAAPQGRIIRLSALQRTAIIMGLTVALIFSLVALVAGSEGVTRLVRQYYATGKHT